MLTFSNGVKLYMTGGISTTKQMAEMADMEIDYAFYRCDGVYNMGLKEAARCAAIRTPANALINGSGNYRVNLLCAILDAVVMRLGLALLFGLAFGMRHMGFWLGDALAGYMPFVIFLFFYFSGKWKKNIVEGK